MDDICEGCEERRGNALKKGVDRQCLEDAPGIFMSEYRCGCKVSDLYIIPIPGDVEHFFTPRKFCHNVTFYVLV